jgi:hypothetical protein
VEDVRLDAKSALAQLTIAPHAKLRIISTHVMCVHLIVRMEHLRITIHKSVIHVTQAVGYARVCKKEVAKNVLRITIIRVGLVF